MGKVACIQCLPFGIEFMGFGFNEHYLLCTSARDQNKRNVAVGTQMPRQIRRA